ncbi:MAG: GntR family transcriptional regulator, partial [Pseudomonas sp.]
MTDKSIPLSEILGSEQVPPHLARSVIEERLRSAILDGRLPPGMALRQQELASLFGVSRMPVREALRQLETQSLLQVVAHKGAVVAPLIGEDAMDSYALRVLLESEALRQSIPRLDADDIALARSYIAQLENETRHAEIGRLNRLFHMSLYSKATNKKLLH